MVKINITILLCMICQTYAKIHIKYFEKCTYKAINRLHAPVFGLARWLRQRERESNGGQGSWSMNAESLKKRK